MFCTTSVLEKCLRFTKPSWWSYSCLVGDTFPKPKSCKTLFLTTKAFIQYIISCFFSSIKTEPDEYEYDFESKPTLFKGIGDLYEELPNEAIILNTIGAALVGLAIVMPCILKCDAFKKGLEPEAGDNSDIE